MAFAEKESSPVPGEVARFHARSDVDTSINAQHHSLGQRPNQAASGAHIHDGKSSLVIPLANLPKPLSGIDISGSKGGNTALASVIAALVVLGATDSTT
jgi:hypothetical protein